MFVFAACVSVIKVCIFKSFIFNIFLINTCIVIFVFNIVSCFWLWNKDKSASHNKKHVCRIYV